MQIFFLLFLITISAGDFFGQSDSVSLLKPDQIIIDSIKIFGNEITEEEIIYRELTFSIGDTVDAEIIAYNRDRIYSLGIFNKVDIFPQNAEERTALIINLEESWYLYPVPFFDLRDKDWDKLSLGLILVLKNFRGRNETLSGLAAFGYDPAFRLTYYKPSITRYSDISFSSSISYQTVNNKSSIARILYGNPFEQTFITAQVTVGRRFGLFHRINLTAGYSYVETPEYIPGISVSDNRIDRLPVLGVGYDYDTRDLIYFPQRGVYAAGNILFKGLGINNIGYQILSLDFRYYEKIIGDFGGKIRAATRFAYGKLVPFYDFSYLGYGERIRGYFDNIREGHHTYKASLEFFYPIIKEMNISFDWIPIIPDELLHYRVGLYTQLFTDTGATKLRERPISISDFDTGFGLGLTLLILPYDQLRIEYAFNENLEGEFIIDLGVSF
jgi:outer membrane protein assembly factor BamA